ncbi:MAG: magnesium transporter [Candidatus Saccharimonadales bacterium]
MSARHNSLWFIVLTVAAASSVSLIGGIGLQAVEYKLLPLVPLVIALPALNTMVGNYATIIAAHTCDPFERKRTRKQLATAVSWSVLINIAGVVVLSLLLAARRNFAVDMWFVTKFAVFVAVAIIISVGFMFLITYLLDKVLEQRKLNPDDVLIPVVTSISDVLMLGLIAAAAYYAF